MGIPFFANVDMNGYAVLNFAVHPSATAPTPGPFIMWGDTATGLLKYYNGTKWVPVNLEDIAVSAPITADKTNPNKPIIGITAATTSAAGSMSATDKIKLDGATSANTASALVQRDASGGANFGIVAATKLTASSSAAAANEVPNLQQVQGMIDGHGNAITVRAVATTNITYSGSAPSTSDGVSLAVGDLLLLPLQTTASQCGIYIVTTLGTGSNGTWTRVADQATPYFRTVANLRVSVSEGTIYADTDWMLATNNPIAVGTTALSFVQMDGASKVIAGNGLTKTGNQLDVQVDNSTLEIVADVVKLKAPYNNFRATATITGNGSTTIFDVTLPTYTTLISVRFTDSTGKEVFIESIPYSSTILRVTFGTAPANGITFNAIVLAA